MQQIKSLHLFVKSSLLALSTAGALTLVSGAAFADGTWTAPDGTVYPYCTNSQDTGGGFGWQPELGGPNGGSCKIYDSGNNGGGGGYPSGTWYDGNGVAFPYCTNGSNTGGGFGWQPELGGPNGGSCKAPDQGPPPDNGGYNRVQATRRLLVMVAGVAAAGDAAVVGDASVAAGGAVDVAAGVAADAAAAAGGAAAGVVIASMPKASTATPAASKSDLGDADQTRTRSAATQATGRFRATASGPTGGGWQRYAAAARRA